MILTGRRFGGYEVRARIGVGGMGEVYRAHDPKLGRDVAIKILPPLFTSDPDRLARFEREARVLASLNHPHIAAIYGIEETDGIRGLVLELVDGETLADRIERGPMAPREALPLAVQIVDALDAAHERGIVHRDLKPANVKITRDGVVKLLDFGLAKAAATDAPAADLSQSPTITLGGTGQGIILGTAAYMSPEQARGHAVDKRADIWAFGCVLYEMLAGRSAFGRDTTTDTLAAIVERDPDWAGLPDSTPSGIVRLLHRCLEKNAKRRLRDIADVRADLTQRDDARPDRDAGTPRSTSGRRIALAGAAGALGVAAAFALGLFMGGDRAPAVAAPAVRFAIAPPNGATFFHNVASTFLALSPDGSQLAFIALSDGLRIWVRPMASLDAQRLAGTDGATSVFWSPDGRSLAFFANNKLKRIDLPGGTPIVLCDAPSISAAGSWGADGTILFASFVGNAIFRVPSTGGAAEKAVTADASRKESVVWPMFLPDGRRFVYLSQFSDSEGRLMLGERGRPSTPITSAISNAAWVDPDFLVYAQEGMLVAQRFDLDSERLVGAPMSIAEPVDRFLSTGRAMFTASRSGTIAYHSHANVSRLVWIDRAGTELGTVGAPGDYQNVRLSPDGGTVLFERTLPGIGTWDLWLADLARGVETRLTSDPGAEAYPAWMPDGRAILLAIGRGPNLNLARMRLETGAVDELLPEGPQQRRPIDVSPDGRTLLFTERSPSGALKIFTLPLAGTPTPAQVFQSRFFEADPRFSPDGRAMSFTSNESGRPGVYVAPFPPTGGKTAVSTGTSIGSGQTDLGGTARWSHDGRELFYIDSDRRLMAVPVRTSPSLRVGTPAPLFTLRGRLWIDFAPSPDGKKFLVTEPIMYAGEQPLSVIVNWSADARRDQAAGTPSSP